MEEGITLTVFPPANSISSSPIDVSQTPHLSYGGLNLPVSSIIHLKGIYIQSCRRFLRCILLFISVSIIWVYSPYLRAIGVGEAHWMSTSKAHSLQYIWEFSYIPRYWEWLEDILFRNRKILTDAKIYDALYNRNVHVTQTFFEYWS